MQRPAVVKVVTFLAGALLLGGGALVIVAADQERVAALDAVKARVDQAEDHLDATKADNMRLAETLTTLRSQIAEQEKQLADKNGFLP